MKPVSTLNTSEQHPEATLSGTNNKMVQRLPSLAATTTTMSTEGSDSTSSIAVSDQDAECFEHVEEQTNKSIDEYFTQEFVHKVNKAAQQENGNLNLNLGLPFDPSFLTRRQPIKMLIRLVHRFLLLVENPLFRIWSQSVPLRLRQKLTFFAWKVYFPFHKLLIGRKTGLHPDVSLEYHALTTVMWWGRLFPVTVQRMRFSLSQLHVCHSPEMYPSWKSIVKELSPQISSSSLSDMKTRNGTKYCLHGHLIEVYHEMHEKRTRTGISSKPKSCLQSHMTVTGKFIQHSSRPSQKVIFWLYGGAYLAGDSEGNLGIAEKLGMMCGRNLPSKDGEMRDVFIPDYRLVPEFHLDDAIHDITLAYEWLISVRGIQPCNVILLGISSGGGLAVLLMQALADSRRKAIELGKFTDDCDLMPAGAVLVGPFVDYTKPKGSMKEYIKHDLIVNQSVFEEGIPFLEIVLGSHENRVRASPVYGNFEGLAPLCVCVSQHEVVYDQSMLLVKRATEQGVDVSVGVWKYMCHVFPMLCSFIPEGRESIQFISEWIKNH